MYFTYYQNRNVCWGAAGGLFGQYEIMRKKLKMTENLANRYSSDRTQWELSNEYWSAWQVLKGFQKSLHPCALDGSSLSIGSVKPCWNTWNTCALCFSYQFPAGWPWKISSTFQTFLTPCTFSNTLKPWLS